MLDAPRPAMKPANPCLLVIFGIAGDLTKRLLYPALCNLGSCGLLDENFCIVGIALTAHTNETFRHQLIQDIHQYVVNPEAKKYGLALAKRVYYITGDFADSHVYQRLNKKLESLTTDHKASKNYLFYFAAPPDSVETIATELSKASLLQEGDGYSRRVIVEKPFGHDLASAIELDKRLLSLMDEEQIFRIDHFLGKETVQNLLAFRFSNGLFEPLWNRLYIDHVQITVAETIGIEKRGNYYENTGALRDMVPNHIFQMLSLVTMEPPSSFSAYQIHHEKIKVLNAVKIQTPEQVLQYTVRGQYAPSKIKGVDIPGYREEYRVDPHSFTETYAALKLYLDNWRWLGVPFYIQTGKRLPERTTIIVIQFKSGPSLLFDEPNQKVQPNLLKIYIQPDEGISLIFNSKVPGPRLELSQVDMRFKYSDYYGIKPQTGYETILFDCMNGDHLLFKQADIVEMGWAIVQPILDVWGALPPRNFPNYAAGTAGPNESHKLLAEDGRKWIL